MNTRNVAFLGLGVMGYPMAGHLARAGHRVTVYNRTAATAARWLGQHPGTSAPTPAAAVAGADLVLMCVGNDNDVRTVVLGADGALAAMRMKRSPAPCAKPKRAAASSPTCRSPSCNRSRAKSPRTFTRC